MPRGAAAGNAGAASAMSRQGLHGLRVSRQDALARLGAGVRAVELRGFAAREDRALRRPAAHDATMCHCRAKAATSENSVLFSLGLRLAGARHR
jgi:hypothetical protein